MKSPGASVLFVTINFNGAGLTRALLDSLSRLRSYESAAVVVVDNASTDASAATLEASIGNSPGVSLFASGEWRGYFGAAQWGISRALTEICPAPAWIIVA